MKKAIRSIAQSLGFNACYHVAAVYNNVNGTANISMTVIVRPWLHDDNYNELVKHVESRAIGTKSTPSITSITRLGL